MERVFLIEDDADFADKLASVLRDLGYTVGIAGGLAKGSLPDRGKILAQVENFAPERVILDLELGAGGPEQGKRLLSELKQTPNLSDAIRCVLSDYVAHRENAVGRDTKSIRDELHQRGADFVLSKAEILREDKFNLDATLIARWLQNGGESHIELPRVLILEDSEGDIDRYRRALNNRAKCLILSPVRATTDLMKAIQDFNPDLIVVDLMLGADKESKKYPGARIIRAIREDPLLKEKPIVVCSKYINPLETDPEAPDVPRKAITKALPKFPFPTADDLLSALNGTLTVSLT